MKKIIPIILLVIFSVSILADPGSEICDYIGGYISDEIPSGVPYSNERMNFYTAEGDVIGHLVIENKKIESFDCTNITEPTYTVTIKNKKTVEDIIDSDKQVDELSSKISDEEIVIKGESVGKKLKGIFTRLGIKLASWFS